MTIASATEERHNASGAHDRVPRQRWDRRGWSGRAIDRLLSAPEEASTARMLVPEFG
jgi:hypothetical protein